MRSNDGKRATAQQPHLSNANPFRWHKIAATPSMGLWCWPFASMLFAIILIRATFRFEQRQAHSLKHAKKEINNNLVLFLFFVALDILHYNCFSHSYYSCRSLILFLIAFCGWIPSLAKALAYHLSHIRCTWNG